MKFENDQIQPMREDLRAINDRLDELADLIGQARAAGESPFSPAREKLAEEMRMLFHQALFYLVKLENLKVQELEKEI